VKKKAMNKLEVNGAMSTPLLFFIIIVEGFVTISAEILTIRQLLPFVGNSVVVTSMIIGIFLLFLAYGYRRGGDYQTNYTDILKSNFTKSAIWLGMGLSNIFIFEFFTLLNPYLNQQVLWVLTLYLLLITAPLVYILGQTVPITMNLIKKAKTTGEIGGKILQLSTLGSFLGALLTSLGLLNYFGVAWTVFINFCLLFILTVVLFSNFKKDGFKIIGLLAAFFVTYGLNVVVENRLFVTTNAYSNYQILKDNNVTHLLINGSPSSMLSASKLGYPYIEYIKKVLFKELNLKNKDILVLGAGGFTLSAEGTFGNRFTYVDIDQNIKNVAEKHLVHKVKGAFIAFDARHFLSTTDQKYDVIISDVYSNHRTIPTHLLTQEYFWGVKTALQKEGIAVFNIIAHPTLKDEYSYYLDNTLRSVFKGCMVVPTEYANKFTNIIYICRGEHRDEKNAIYKDNLNRTTLDFFRSLVFARE